MLTSKFKYPEQVRNIVSCGFNSESALVVGDLMLDIHVWGDVTRISPEAPVPVIRRTRQMLVAGGAGNVAANLAGLGMKTRLVGLVGSDKAAEQMREELLRTGVDVSGILTDTGRSTTTKMRIIGGHQQMLRLDQESVHMASGAIEKAIATKIIEGVHNAAVVILSDYAKGVLTPLICQTAIEEAQRKGIPVLVDPKGTDWEKYRGATCITPNRSELLSVAGYALPNKCAIAKMADELLTTFDLKALTVTLSEEGMLHACKKGCIHVPAMAKDVFDVSGAGDTSIATLAASLATGIEDQDALILANIAAGIVVGKVGTVPLEKGELAALLENGWPNVKDSKVKTIDEIRSLVRAWKAKGERIVFTNGCFDLLHVGYVTYLTKARNLGDRLVIGLHSDASVKCLKGAQWPINNQEQRAFVLAGLEAVDAVILLEENTPLDLIMDLRPDIVVHGADSREDDIIGAKEVRSWGGSVSLIELVKGVSTTSIANKITNDS